MSKDTSVQGMSHLTDTKGAEQMCKVQHECRKLPSTKPLGDFGSGADLHPAPEPFHQPSIQSCSRDWQSIE